VHVSIAGPLEQASAEAATALAREHGLSRIGYVSGSTVDERNRWFPMVAQKLNAEQAVAASGVAWTVFRPTWPFETLARFVRGGKATVIGKIPTLYHWFAADDFARMVSTAYRTDEAADKRLYVHGPEAIVMREALDRYRAALHPEIASVSTLPTWLGRVIATVTRNDMLKFACALMAYFERAGEPGDPTEANRLLGAPTTTLDAWLAARKAG
jgi:NADH dehydrogenase